MIVAGTSAAEAMHNATQGAIRLREVGIALRDYVPHICTGECDPGNCEAEHRRHFGWDAVEMSAPAPTV